MTKFCPLLLTDTGHFPSLCGGDGHDILSLDVKFPDTITSQNLQRKYFDSVKPKPKIVTEALPVIGPLVGYNDEVFRDDKYVKSTKLPAINWL